MTTLEVALAVLAEQRSGCSLVGIGSGMFNSPNTAAMMGTVPAHRRGIAAGARTMLQNTGAVISIAFVLAIVTAAVPKDVLLAIFSGVATGLSDARLDPFIHNMHTALWVLAATSLVGAVVSLLRPTHGDAARGRSSRPSGMTQRRSGCASARSRARLGTTPRTIRYYEEIGLLGCPGERARGAAAPHLRRGRRRAPARRAAASSSCSASRSRSSGELLEAEEARAALRDEWQHARPRRRRGGARSSTRRSATSTASSSSCAAAARRSTRSRPSSSSGGSASEISWSAPD